MTHATDEAGRQEGLADQASEKVQQAAGAAKETASELREEGSARLRDQVDERSTQAGEQARSLAQALRRSGDELGEEGNAGAARLTGEAAERIERLGGYLERTSGDQLLRDLEGFARRRPWLLAGLGAVAGIAAARFLKASSQQRSGDGAGRHGSGLTREPSAYAELPAAGRPFPARPELPEDVAGAPGDEPLARDPYPAGR